MRWIASAARAAAQLDNDLEKHKIGVLAVFSLLYWLGTCALAVWTPMWYDELFTFHFSRLPSVSAIWSALAAADDLNPPLTYLLTRASHTLFGEGQLATRLPAVAGFWLMSLCLFRFVERRSGAALGAVAMLIPCFTKAYGYAYEARAYGIVLGCCGLALVCWQSAAEGQRRSLALAGLWFALAAAVSSHYWAVLLAVPLAAGEAVRWGRRKAPDWPVWAVLLLGISPLCLYLPMVRAASIFLTPIPAQPALSSIPETYTFVLEPALWSLAVLLGLATVWPAQEWNGSAMDGGRKPPFHEVAAAATLMALPVMGVALSKLANTAYMPRYTVAMAAGAGVLVTYGIRLRAGGRKTLPFLTFALLMGGFVIQQSLFSLLLAAKPPARFQVLPFDPAAGERDLPVVASTPNLFLQLAHYAPPELAGRVYYLSDMKIAMERVHTNTWELGLNRLRRWTPLQIADYRSFVASNRKFLVYGPYLGVWDWVAPQLMEDGARVELRGRAGQDLVFLITIGAAASREGTIQRTGRN